MFLKMFQGLLIVVALLLNLITSTQVFYRLSSKDGDMKIEDERVPFLTQSFFTCGSDGDCKGVAKNKGSGQFKEANGQEVNAEEFVTYTKVIGENPLINCQDAYNKGYKSTIVLPINIPGMGPKNVRCDMVTDGGGWIVFQRRVDASVDFYRGWDEYKNGFGDLNGNFWLGLEKIHKLTSQGKRAILRVDLKHFRDPNRIQYAVYTTFEIASESEGYRLTFSGYTGNAGDSLLNYNGMKFSTKDRDNDLWSLNCAQSLHGAWWYRWCAYSNLNGLFPQQNQEDQKYISWYHLHGDYGGVIFSEMKIKYSNP